MNQSNLSASSFLSAAAITMATALGPAAYGQYGSTYVDARCNIFGYGVSTPQPGGGGGGLLAVTINLPPGIGRTVSFSGSGTAWWNPSVGSNGPDGGTIAANTNITAVGPVSGFAAPRSGHLVGLFIEAGDISALAAPSALSYPTTAAFTLTTYSPALRQVFFIGDGLTGTGAGTRQIFQIPDGAARLELGIADAFAFNGLAGYYNDNVRGYTVVYGSACYPNCDNSNSVPVLNVADFTCFLQRFAAQDPYANCDGSTVAPVLNVADFSCFLQRFAVGCP